MESVFLVTAIIGGIEFVKAANSADWQTCEIIALAVIIGVITGIYGVDGLTVPTGIQMALAASGTYKTAQLVGGLK